MLASVVVIYLQRNLYITMPFAAFLTTVLFAIVVAVGLYRWRYTRDFRDPRFWSKRNFARAKDPCEGNSCTPKKSACNEPEEPTCPGPDWDKMSSEAGKYVEDTLSPYGDIAQDTGMGVGAGVGLGAVMVAGSLAYGGYRTASTMRRQAGSLGNQIKGGASRAQSQLESDTIAYITGDNRNKTKPAQTCPYGGEPTVGGVRPQSLPVLATEIRVYSGNTTDPNSKEMIMPLTTDRALTKTDVEQAKQMVLPNGRFIAWRSSPGDSWKPMSSYPGPYSAK
jgi:hypothetical protein